MTRAGPLLLLLVSLAVPSAPTWASDLTSASYRIRGATIGSSGSPAGTLGQAEALGFAGDGATLTTHAPGFWPIAAGGLPSLDADADGIPAYADTDDDQDGLPDDVETDTGMFVSGSDTGSDPNDPDSDDDGFPDGFEVAQGTDPNSDASVPVAEVPALPGAFTPVLWLGLALAAAAAGVFRRRR